MSSPTSSTTTVAVASPDEAMRSFGITTAKITILKCLEDNCISVLKGHDNPSDFFCNALFDCFWVDVEAGVIGYRFADKANTSSFLDDTYEELMTRDDLEDDQQVACGYNVPFELKSNYLARDEDDAPSFRWKRISEAQFKSDYPNAVDLIQA